MAEQVEVKLGGKSQEEVALELTNALLRMEGKFSGTGGYRDITASDVLERYKQVLKVVRNPFLGG